MNRKQLICPERVRRVPQKFSWIDHRLVRDRHIRRCSPEGLALYLFLVCVGDAQGLSYYADRTVAELISVDEVRLRELRQELKRVGLIAYKRPLYQVLSLEAVHAAGGREPQRANRCLSIAEILRGSGGHHD